MCILTGIQEERRCNNKKNKTRKKTHKKNQRSQSVNNLNKYKNRNVTQRQ